MKLGNLIDPFQPSAGAPPQTLAAFMAWCLKGCYGVLSLGVVAAVIAGNLEVVTAMLLGLIIDHALQSGPEAFFSENMGLLLGIVVFMVVFRPAAFGLGTAINSIAVAPNVNPLVLSRLNKYTLGQSVDFFDNDFAGRIAQKQMQTASALTNVVVESINVVAFALASLIGASH